MGEHTYVEDELDKAREALTDADQLTAAGGSDAGIVNRLYYACFHAAQAALYDGDVHPSSHGAVQRLFGRELVLGDDATRAQGRLLAELSDLRQQADYGYEPLDVDVESLHNRTVEFVAAMETIVGADDGSDGE